MPDSQPYSIAKQFKTWTESITVANGFNTDVGARVYLGREYFDVDTSTFPLLSILWELSVIDSVETEHQEQIDVTVAGFVPMSGDGTDLDTADALFQDIRASVLLTSDLAYVHQIRPVSGGIIQPDPESRLIRVSMVYAAAYFEEYGA